MLNIDKLKLCLEQFEHLKDKEKDILPTDLLKLEEILDAKEVLLTAIIIHAKREVEIYDNIFKKVS